MSEHGYSGGCEGMGAILAAHRGRHSHHLVTERSWYRPGNGADNSVLPVKWLLSKLGNGGGNGLTLPNTDLKGRSISVISSVSELTFRNASFGGCYL